MRKALFNISKLKLKYGLAITALSREAVITAKIQSGKGEILYAQTIKRAYWEGTDKDCTDKRSLIKKRPILTEITEL